MFKKYDEACYVIYKHTHKENGKVYIGMTCDIETRWGINGSGYTSDKYSLFGRAIKKYGWDAFEHEIIESGLTWEEANEREAYYIDLYKCNVVRYPELNAGYNLTDGGCGTKGHPLSEEAKKKLSQHNSGKGNPRYGVVMSEETKHKISVAKKGKYTGENSYWYGRKQTPEHRARVMANRPDFSGVNNPRARRVICVETGVVYDLIKDAAEAVGCHHMNIIHACRGAQKTAAGYHWKYYEPADAIASA